MKFGTNTFWTGDFMLDGGTALDDDIATYSAVGSVSARAGWASLRR